MLHFSHRSRASINSMLLTSSGNNELFGYLRTKKSVPNFRYHLLRWNLRWHQTCIEEYTCDGSFSNKYTAA